MHHLVNVLFHLLTSLVLFAVLLRSTGATGPSAFVAFVFALHPLHVGSVAWIAERKDMLSALFWFLALYAYVWYTERPGRVRYSLVLALFGLGLLSKPMVVTFPFALLLFDVWPLRRVQWGRAQWGRVQSGRGRSGSGQWRNLIWEKVPLIACSAIASAVTYRVQSATASMNLPPLGMRVGNALISYVIYTRQMFWPTRLSVFYPYPHSVVAWQAVGALVLILGVSALVILSVRTRPYLALGWFWYLGTLVPVIGLVQVGEQARADRYTYIPLVGLTIMLAWGAADLVARWPRVQLLGPAIAAASTALCVMYVALAWKETGYWQNSETLFRRAIEVTEPSWQIESYMGQYLVKLPNRRAEAIPYLEAALRLKPDLPNVSNNLGVSLFEIGLYGAAIPHFEAVLRADPNSVTANHNLGMCLVNLGRTEEGLTHLEAAQRIRPDAETERIINGLKIKHQ
jgi:hypothetical protein